MNSVAFPRPIEPTRTPAAYIGGKKQLSKRLVGLINATPHTHYAEAFVGMGGVFLKRTLQPRAEVINGFNGEVATLFRILQRHYVPFMEMLRYQRGAGISSSLIAVYVSTALPCCKEAPSSLFSRCGIACRRSASRSALSTWRGWS